MLKHLGRKALLRNECLSKIALHIELIGDELIGAQDDIKTAIALLKENRR